jgi:1,2-diacylglycerol 3-alpha-glucosyltransferase
MRILISTTMYPPDLNGQSVFCNNLVMGMAGRGHQVLVLHPACKHTNDAPSAAMTGIQYESVAGIQLGFIHPDLRLTFLHSLKVRRVFDRFQPDLVHVQDPSPLCRAVLNEARRRGIPSLATHHPGPEVSAPYFIQWTGLFKRIAERIAWRMIVGHLNQADQVTVPSRSSVLMLIAHGLQKTVRSLSCGIPLDDFYPKPDLARGAVLQNYGIDPQRPMILYVGRVDGEKRVDVLIRALVCMDREDVQLVVAGTGSMESSLRRLTQELGVQEQVHFIGKVLHADLPDLLNSTDLFAMPGDAESFSIATLEAMACGKPVLAANAAALPELVTHLENGYLFAPGQPEDAAQGIETLLRNRGEWAYMEQVSINRTLSHRLENVLSQYEAVYRSCMTSSRQAEPSIKPVVAARERRWLFQPLLLLVFLSAMLFSLVYNPPTTQAAPLLQLEVSAPLNLDEIREFLNVTPSGNEQSVDPDALIHVVYNEDEHLKVVVVHPKIRFGAQSSEGKNHPLFEDRLQSLHSKLIELGVPEDIFEFLPSSGSVDEGNQIYNRPRNDIFAH